MEMCEGHARTDCKGVQLLEEQWAKAVQLGPGTLEGLGGTEGCAGNLPPTAHPGMPPPGSALLVAWLLRHQLHHNCPATWRQQCPCP
jgi:hypothetical protein